MADSLPESPPILVILGPTASGKSDVALAVARSTGAEILSVDSMQVYRGMDVGTAKPSAAERAAVPHHGIDVCAPDEEMTAGRFLSLGTAEAVLAAGLERLSADYKGESKEKLFNDLRIFVAGGADPPPTYAELTDRLGIAESTLRSHVTRLRARYLEALRAEVCRTVHTETQVDEELRELIHVLTEG